MSDIEPKSWVNDTVEAMIPTRLPNYVTDFSRQVYFMEKLGETNGPVDALFTCRYIINGQGFEYSWTIPDAMRIIGKYPADAINQFWDELFEVNRKRVEKGGVK